MLGMILYSGTYLKICVQICDDAGGGRPLSWEISAEYVRF